MPVPVPGRGVLLADDRSFILSTSRGLHTQYK